MEAILPYLVPATAAVIVAAIGAVASVAGRRTEAEKRSQEALIVLLREERDEARREVSELQSIVAEYRPVRRRHRA